MLPQAASTTVISLRRRLPGRSLARESVAFRNGHQARATSDGQPKLVEGAAYRNGEGNASHWPVCHSGSVLHRPIDPAMLN